MTFTLMIIFLLSPVGPLTVPRNDPCAQCLKRRTLCFCSVRDHSLFMQGRDHQIFFGFKWGLSEVNSKHSNKGDSRYNYP